MENYNQTGGAGGGEGEEKSFGPLLAIIIIVALLAVGGFYIWNSSQKSAPGSEQAGLNLGDEVANALGTQSDSTDIGSIESDLNSLNVESLDSSLPEIPVE